MATTIEKIDEDNLKITTTNETILTKEFLLEEKKICEDFIAEKQAELSEINSKIERFK